MARTLLITLMIVGLFDVSWALDKHSTVAAKQTQELLTSKSKRKAAVKTGDAKKLDEYISKLAHDDPKVIQKIYELAADIFPATVKDANGNPAKMKALVDGYKDNPEDFINSLTDEQKQKIHELSIILTSPTQKN